MVWSKSNATPKSGVVGYQGREPPFLCLLHLVISTLSPHGCPRLGLLSGAVAQGLHKGDSAGIAESQEEMHAGLCPLGWKEVSLGASPPASSSQRLFLSCHCRTCSETSSSTAQGWSLCLTSVTSSCTTRMPAPTRPSATPSSRPPGAWTGAGGTSAPCPWSGG